jgi:gas vesicle protein
VYFKDPELDLKYGQLIYEIKSGQLMNSDDKTLEDADLIAQIGLEIMNAVKEQHEEIT